MRPVEPVARVHPQRDRASLGAFSAFREQQTSGAPAERRLPTPTFRPARPSSDSFFAQIMSQASDAQRSEPRPLAADAPARGAEAYRRAGAEPAFLSQDPELFRIVA